MMVLWPRLEALSVFARPSLLCLEGQMNDRNVSMVDKDTTHSFMSRKLIKELGLDDT
jgi:hypothetical protein